MTASLETLRLASEVVLDEFKLSFKQFQTQFPYTNSYTLALSGGIDSIVLLNLLSKLVHQNQIAPTQLNAIYIDHQLQDDSANWGVFCEKKCDFYGIPFQSIKVSIENQSRQGIEQLARQARYEALFDSLENQKSVLLTAHHANDQAETLLLNLFRGSGVSGLGAMQAVSQSDRGILFRPLLNLSQQQLENYASFHQLKWIDDPSNKNCAFRRNWVRHQMLPMIKQTYPNAVQTLAQTTERMQEAEQLLEKMAQMQLKAHCQHIENAFKSWGFPLAEKLFSEPVLSNENSLSWSEFKNVFRYWVKNRQFPRLNESIFDWLLNTAYQNSQQAGVKRCKSALSGEYKLSSGGSWQLYNQSIFYLPAGKNVSMDLQTFLESTHDSFSVPNQALSELERFKKPLQIYLVGSCLPRLENILLVSLSELNNDMQQSLNRKALKRFFQKYKIPVWQRNQWPFLVSIKHPTSIKLVGCLGEPNLIESACKEMTSRKTVSIFQFIESHWQTKFCWPHDKKSIIDKQ